MALAASLVAMVGIYTQFQGSESSGPVIAEQRFYTGRGERKIASLSDGSQIELNTGSSLRAAIGDGTREVWLDKGERSEEHTSELQSLMRSSYSVLWLKKKKNTQHTTVIQVN